MVGQKNDHIDEIPMVAPARDEIASFNRSRGGNKSASKSTMQSAPAGMGGGAKFMLFLSFVLAAAAVAGAAYLYQQLTATQASLSAAADRVSSLENRLSSTDESMTASTATHGVRIKELTSEVDKLWAARRKSSGMQDKNTKNLGAHANKLSKTEKLVTTLQQSLAGLRVQLEAAKALPSQVKSLQSGAIASQATVSEIEEAVDSARKALSVVQKRVAENEEWVASFNAYRRQTNDALQQLKRVTSPSTSVPVAE